ncbi:MAG: hypothetical protein KC464_15310, partial [Myxococcales bacterium]|nr:hypothetical protein [Myxococcales bacterium]
AVADGVATGAILALGIALVALTGNRWGVAPLAWIAPVPFLLVARRAATWRHRLVLLAALMAGASLQIAKVVTAPVPVALIIPFAAPTALTAWLVVLGVEALRRRAGEVAALLAFPALAALGDVAQYTLSPLGVWGTAAQTQVGDLALMQLAALVGVGGIGFVMALVPAALALVLGAPAPGRHARAVVAAFAVVAAAYTWGAIRVFTPAPGPTVTVAAVVTDLGLSSAGLPTPAELAVNEDVLFARTRAAAGRGARVVVWNEVATVVAPDDEARLIARGAATARDLGVDLIMAYGVVLDDAPLSLDNKYVWFDERGGEVETYRKHHPVPGEPSLTGTAPLAVHDRPWGRAAGAICFDYDFPAMARAHAALGADVVLVPSSDWRGIEPYHTEMARVRGLEAGVSLVRSTRWGASAAYDAFGRTRAAMSAFEANDRIMVADVPVARVETVYAQLGDTPVVGLSLVILLGIAASVRRRARPR